MRKRNALLPSITQSVALFVKRCFKHQTVLALTAVSLGAVIEQVLMNAEGLATVWNYSESAESERRVTEGSSRSSECAIPVWFDPGEPLLDRVRPDSTPRSLERRSQCANL